MAVLYIYSRKYDSLLSSASVRNLRHSAGELCPDGTALFRMELHARDVVPAADSRDGTVVIGGGDDIGRISRRLVVGMDEIDFRMGRQVLLRQWG